MISPPPINGLVLAGGFSTRMGTDKSLIDYHGKPQRIYVLEQLGTYCEQAFISCRPEQATDLPREITITDKHEDIGPIAGVLSAFEHNPNSAWMVIGVDYPYLQREDLQLLLDARNPNKIATCFKNPVKKWPEPMLAIWEPGAFPLLQAAQRNGHHGMRRLLSEWDVALVQPRNLKAISSIDTPEAWKK